MEILSYRPILSLSPNQWDLIVRVDAPISTKEWEHQNTASLSQDEMPR